MIPGIVGMHNHLYHIARPNLHADGSSDSPLMVPQMLFSSPLLYLANGVTTMRTTGSVEPYADLNERKMIDDGKLAGPHIDVTAPYLEGGTSYFIQMHFLSGPEDARKTVDYWADEGATSFKAYMNITRDELKAAIDAAHKRGLKITGHLCSVTYPEAIDLGIDDLEHGFFVNTQLDPGKKPDECSQSQGMATLMAMDPNGEAAKQLIAKLVAKNVAITSTLPVFEHMVPNRPPLQQRVLDAMTPELANGSCSRAIAVPVPRGATKPRLRFVAIWISSAPLLLPADCFLRGRIRRAMAVRCPDSGTSAKSNCWSKPDSRRSRQLRSQPGTERCILASRTISVRLRRERTPTWWW